MKKLIPFLCSLLVVTAACGGGSSPSSEDQKVVDDLAAVIAEDSEFDGTADDAECIAETIVTSLGSTYIRDNNLTDSGTYNDWDPFEAELSRDQFGQVLQGTFGCVTNEISNFLGDEADLDGLSKESVKCIVDLFQDDEIIDVLYDAGSNFDDDPPMEFIEGMFTKCPSVIVDGFVNEAGLDRKAAECFVDELPPEFLGFAMAASALPSDEMPEDSTEVLADFLAAAVKCDIDLADLG